MANATTSTRGASRKPRRTAATEVARIPGPMPHWSELVLRVAMLGVSLGSVAQMLGYNDLGHALMAVGGACGANAHLKGGN